MIDLGDVVARTFNVTTASGALAAATAVVATVTLPDGTTTAPTVTNTTTGVYTITYTPLVVGLFQLRWVATGTNAQASTEAFYVAVAAAAVISVDEAKAHLNITDADTDRDAEIRELVDVATATCELFCGRPLSRTIITETHSGGAGGLIVLRTAGVLAVTTVTVDAVAAAATEWALLNDVVLAAVSGSAIGSWAAGVNNITVTLTAGVTGRELSVARQGVKELLRHLWQTQRGARKTNYNADQPEQGMGYAMPNRVAQLLEPLRFGGFA